jgi:hypothetical protein
MNTTDYPWNLRIDVAGVTFTGPGMESKQAAEAIKTNIEQKDAVDNAEVFSQQ